MARTSRPSIPLPAVVASPPLAPISSVISLKQLPKSFGDLRCVKPQILRSPPVHGQCTQAQQKQAGRCPTEDQIEMSKIVQFLKDESGGAAIEYSLIAAATGLALIAIIPAIKERLQGTLTSVSDRF